MKYSTPSNWLTASRLILAPCLLSWLIIDYMYSATIVFAIMVSTDYLDGIIARMWCQESIFGAWMDPLADKVLLASVVLPLISLNIVHWSFGLVCIIREFVVLSVRYTAALHGVTIHVSEWGKCKTALQFGYLGMCLIELGAFFAAVRSMMSYCAVAMTIGSMLGYMYQLSRIEKKDNA